MTTRRRRRGTGGPTAVERILDANLNRAREGLRVAEEVARLRLEDPGLQSRFRRLRHGITAAERAWSGPAVLSGRSAARDPGAGNRTPRELRRRDLADAARANLRRAQEALRVLEEIGPLKTPGSGVRFQRLRFEAYVLESRMDEAFRADPGRTEPKRKRGRQA